MKGWLSALTTPFADDTKEDNQPPQQRESTEIVTPPGKQLQQFSWSVLHWVVLVESIVIVILVIILLLRTH